ncbi:PTS sugar transporter subunit IIA [Salibacterium halotolerans]|uniref:Ascorbate-specific PTS system EIIA component n=1 Tax=Salibacterium halotolerans TaxID=1884432 RepID=A0A1I5L8J4_9BACI|nr:PTS sugar transporter subunit IIA [Salibacterium halotolerans]SFO93577.1 PTS system, ascorbate-specific IIA component [Salibacterium halotolerans]
MLKELLPRENLQNFSEVSSWEAAIAIAGQPLLKKKIIEEEYISSMIESVHENGPYIVLADCFALPHAKPGEGVYSMGMSLLTLDNPVDLKGNQVKVFLVLAAIDSTSHLSALSEISEILMEEENYKIFMEGSLDKIYELL